MPYNQYILKVIPGTSYITYNGSNHITLSLYEDNNSDHEEYCYGMLTHSCFSFKEEKNGKQLKFFILNGDEENDCQMSSIIIGYIEINRNNTLVINPYHNVLKVLDEKGNELKRLTIKRHDGRVVEEPYYNNLLSNIIRDIKSYLPEHNNYNYTLTCNDIDKSIVEIRNLKNTSISILPNSTVILMNGKTVEYNPFNGVNSNIEIEGNKIMKRISLFRNKKDGKIMWSPCSVDGQCNNNYERKALDKDCNNYKEKATALKLTQNGEVKLKSIIFYADISDGLISKNMNEVLANEIATIEGIRDYNIKNGTTTTNLHRIADTHLVNANGTNFRMITDTRTDSAMILVTMISLIIPLALIFCVVYNYFNGKKQQSNSRGSRSSTEKRSKSIESFNVPIDNDTTSFNLHKNFISMKSINHQSEPEIREYDNLNFDNHTEDKAFISDSSSETSSIISDISLAAGFTELSKRPL